MKRRSKMFFAATACLALVSACALFGCASPNQTADEADGEATGQVEGTIEAETADAAAVELQVFAANSLSKAMEEAQAAYTEANPNVTFADTQYKSSGELNELLEGGATADVLVSASKSKMDDAEEAGLVDPETRFNMFTNDLVMVVVEDSDVEELTLDDIATGEYTICVGDDSVPAGNYANQSLSTVGCFVDPDGKMGPESDGKANGTDAYAGTPVDGKVVTDTSVGNVCEHASTGDVDVAFVYASDVYRFGGVKVVGTVPADTHKSIVYPAAVTADTANAEAASAFLDWCMNDPEAAQVWEAWGFEVAAE
jgi:molybdate transport system substrate-binding protein